MIIQRKISNPPEKLSSIVPMISNPGATSRQFAHFALLDVGSSNNVSMFVTPGAGIPWEFSLRRRFNALLRQLHCKNFASDHSLDLTKLRLVMGLGGSSIGFNPNPSIGEHSLKALHDFVAFGSSGGAIIDFHSISESENSKRPAGTMDFTNDPFGFGTGLTGMKSRLHLPEEVCVSRSDDMTIYPAGQMLFSVPTTRKHDLADHMFIAETNLKSTLAELLPKLLRTLNITEKCMIMIKGFVQSVDLLISNGYVPQPGKGVEKEKAFAHTVQQPGWSTIVTCTNPELPEPTMAHSHLSSITHVGGHVLDATLSSGAGLVVMIPHHTYSYDSSPINHTPALE
ncbi:hypothetical protein KKF81_03285 [Candidatus Micrarchaeota archaeon]|nr:hypothetical protein [Candidatus Micrarchaeota archaeon]